MSQLAIIATGILVWLGLSQLCVTLYADSLTTQGPALTRPRSAALPCPSLPRLPPVGTLQVLATRDGVILRGEVRDATLRAELREKLQLTTTPLIDDLTLDAAAPAMSIEPATLHRLVGAMKGWPPLALWIHRDEVVLFGAVASEQEKRSRAQRIAALLPNHILTDVSLDPAALAQEINQALRHGVDFLRSSAILAPNSEQRLDRVVTLLKATNPARYQIAVHTDGRGSASLRLELSQLRAEAIRDYLVQQGISAGRLCPVGYGALQPLAFERDEASIRSNQRIEFILAPNS